MVDEVPRVLLGASFVFGAVSLLERHSGPTESVGPLLRAAVTSLQSDTTSFAGSREDDLSSIPYFFMRVTEYSMSFTETASSLISE